jgi:hypothetical protein
MFLGDHADVFREDSVEEAGTVEEE